jgi:nucleotidyltransferase/DNA polymerase involved in DNA repair
VQSVLNLKSIAVIDFDVFYADWESVQRKGTASKQAVVLLKCPHVGFGPSATAPP